MLAVRSSPHSQRYSERYTMVFRIIVLPLWFGALWLTCSVNRILHLYLHQQWLLPSRSHGVITSNYKDACCQTRQLICLSYREALPYTSACSVASVYWNFLPSMHVHGKDFVCSILSSLHSFLISFSLICEENGFLVGLSHSSSLLNISEKILKKKE